MAADPTASAGADAASQEDTAQTARSDSDSVQQGLFDEFKALIGSIRALIKDHAHIAALETRQAGESLVKIIAMGLIATFMIFTGWLALIGALVMLLLAFTALSPIIALLLVVLVHGLATVGLVFAIRTQSRHLLFPTVVQNLNPTRETPSPEKNPNE